MRRTRTTVVVLVVLFTLVGFIGVPLLAQYVVAGRLAASLHRPVSMARVRFNPYTLRLNVNRLHIGDRETSERFVDIGHIQVKISWSSLFRLAPVVGEVAVRRPEIHIVRTADQRFNFSDLLESSGPTPAPTPAPAEPPKPQRFAVSNIQIHDGQVDFDDKVLGERHTLEHLELDVPFIANLPADVNIFVQPLLQMVVDGSPLRIGGKAKPFAVPPESEIDLNLHRLSIPLYIGYVPRKLPLKVPQGMLSSQLQVHFVNAASAPEIRIAGEVAIDELDVRDTADAPLAGFKHMSVVLTELKPLESITHLGKIYLDGLTVHVARNRDGTINLASLAGTSPAPPAAARAKPSPAAPIAAAPTAVPAKPGPAEPGRDRSRGGKALCDTESRERQNRRRREYPRGYRYGRRHAGTRDEHRAANRERATGGGADAAAGGHSQAIGTSRRIAGSTGVDQWRGGYHRQQRYAAGGARAEEPARRTERPAYRWAEDAGPV